MRNFAIYFIIINVLTIPFAYSNALKDPTLPVYYSGLYGRYAVNGLTVNAILISKHRKIAIVNHESLKIGDKILKSKVISIMPNAVKFQNAKHGEFIVYLHNKNDLIKTKVH